MELPPRPLLEKKLQQAVQLARRQIPKTTGTGE
jgi:hypothetical protein